ncbi:MAG TPA: hypothetical protein VN043_04985 [Rhodanobacter sp.]|nr:hypothetical protein [Rhodanobacter sp.]
MTHIILAWISAVAWLAARVVMHFPLIMIGRLYVYSMNMSIIRDFGVAHAVLAYAMPEKSFAVSTPAS